MSGPITRVNNRSIFVTFQREGIHAYPEALTNPALADVSFLGHPHRHIFHYIVELPVSHDDRDVEFIQLKRWCEKQLDEQGDDLGRGSCEMMAEAMGRAVINHWGVRRCKVTVSEDGENGATVELIRGSGY